MKSSSDLFPVSLIRADLAGDYNEDTYLLKHNQSHDKTVQVALTRLSLVNTEKLNAKPIVLVHDLFKNRGSWIDSDGNGLAAYLVSQGFDIWMLEHRGHGLAPKNDDFVENTSESYIKYDYPAVEAFIEEQTGKKPNWLGHGYGGVNIMAAMAAGYIENTSETKIVLLGSEIFKKKLRTLIIPFYYTVSVMLRKAKYWEGPGPEFEPKAIRHERLWWRSMFGAWKGRENKIPYLKRLPELSGKALIFAGGKDKQSPAKRCKKWQKYLTGMETEIHLLAKKTGYKYNYNHDDLVYRLEGKEEFWPEIKNLFAS